jgi:hypothetical protein
MKVRGFVTETIIVVKEIDVEVPDDAEEDAIHTAVRDACYAEIVTPHNGWELAETLDMDVKWEKYVLCATCGKQELEDLYTQCQYCATHPPTCEEGT